MRAKACKACGETFTPTRSIQPTCGKFDCNVVYALMVMQENKAKRERKEHREAKARHKN
jgi:RNA polymerase subunit RPABC4/transcription elongation factor Spt4